MMMMELHHFSKEIMRGRHDPLRFLMLLSLVKDDLPWLYDLGVDAYQQTTRHAPTAKEARQRVFSALKMLRHGPWMEMFETKETYMVFRELEHLIHEFPEDEEQMIKPRRSQALVAEKGRPKSDSNT